MQKQLREGTFENQIVPAGTYVIRCRRKDHRIVVTKKGRILFLDHGNASWLAVQSEGEAAGKDQRGCYAVLSALRSNNGHNKWVRTHGGRRTRIMRDLYEAGCPDNFFPVLAAVTERRYYRRSCLIKDTYTKPFLESRWTYSSRTAAIYEIRVEKLRRFMDGVVKRHQKKLDTHDQDRT